MKGPISSPRRPITPLTAIAVLLATLWTLAQFRVVSYVVTSDPKLYLTLARTLASSPIGSSEWRTAFAQISPLWPVMLALCWRWLGAWAPYWLNWGLGLLWLVALRLLIARRWAAGGTGAFVLAAVPAIVVRAHPLELEWLLHPYREMSAMLFLTALWAVLPDVPRAAGRWLGAGTLGLLATLAREPTALALAGPVCVAVAARDEPWSGRARAIAAFAAPFAVTAALWWFTRTVTGLEEWTGQLHGFRHEMFELERWRRAAANLWQLWQWWVGGLGLLGSIGAAIGLARAVRRRDPAAWLAAATVITIPFYALYLAAPRYLTIAWLGAAWMAAEGWAEVLEWFRARSPRYRGPSTALAVLAALLATAGRTMMEPSLTLGPRFGWQETRRAAAAIDAVCAGGPLFIERDCRAIESLVLHHANAPLRWPETAGEGAPSGAVFAKPLNAACYTPARVRRGGVRVEEWLLQAGRLSVPAEKTPGGSTIVLGEGRYRLLRFTAWTDGVPASASGRMRLPGGSQAVWLDLRKAPVGRWMFAWRSVDGGLLMWSGEGCGLHSLLIDAVTAEREGEWWLRADGPVPADPIAAIQQGSEVVWFEMGPMRWLSAQRWFQPPFVTGSTAERHGAALLEGGRLQLPPMALGTAGRAARLAVTLELAPVGTLTGTTISVRGNGRQLARRVMGRQGGTVAWTTELQPGSGAEVELECVPPLSPRGFFRVRAIGLMLSAVASPPAEQ